MNLFTKKEHNSVLGMAYDHNVLTMAVLEKNGKGVKVRKTASVIMALDFLSGDPELVGHEIRNHLHEAGIHESHCVFSMPVQWVMSQHIELPALSKEDETSFIHLHAEREFPFPLHDLAVSYSVYHGLDEKRIALVSAIPNRQIEMIKTIFQMAKLNLISVTVGNANFNESSLDVQMLLQKREQGTDCFIVSGSSVISMRHFNHHEEDIEGMFDIDAEGFKREIRITLGQLPLIVRTALKTVYLYGPDVWCVEIRGEIRTLPECRNFSVEQKSVHYHIHLPDSPEQGYEFSAAAGCACQYIQNQSSSLEYLPPYISRIEKMMRQVSSKRNLVISEVAAVLLIIFAGLFGYQRYTYSMLSSKWDRIADQVTELEEIQQNMKAFRPWFHRGMPSLMVMKTVTDTFPDEGSIWLKTIQIENESIITCNGFSENNQVFLSTYDRLKENGNVGLLQVKQQTGNSPMQYSFQFQWSEG